MDAHTLSVRKTDGRRNIWPSNMRSSPPARVPRPSPACPASPRIWDSTGALELEIIPKNLLVIGGGYIGLELGSVYAALGTKVTVVEMMPGLLPGADRDLVHPLAKRLEKQLRGDPAEHEGRGRRRKRRTASACASRDPRSRTPEQVFDRVLVSVGRKPNTGDLGLENTGVEVDERGFVEVDAQRRTAEPRSSPSATSPASRCSRTRPPTRARWPSRSSPATRPRSSPAPSRPWSSPIPRSPGAG